MTDDQVRQTVEDFGKTKSKLRLLIATDIASEGLNLHFQSHRLVHFDIPWSLMVFQQRNGRVDRYGQRQTPLIAYLFNETAQREDQRRSAGDRDPDRQGRAGGEEHRRPVDLHGAL